MNKLAILSVAFYIAMCGAVELVDRYKNAPPTCAPYPPCIEWEFENKAGVIIRYEPCPEFKIRYSCENTGVK